MLFRFDLGFDIDATKWTEFDSSKPLVNTRNVKQMHARQSSNIFAFLKFAQANGALFRVIFLAVAIDAAVATQKSLVRVRKRIAFNASLRGASR